VTWIGHDGGVIVNPIFEFNNRVPKRADEGVGKVAWDHARSQAVALWSTIQLFLPAILGGVYVWWWDKKFSLRQRLGIWAGWGLLALIFIELGVGPVLDLFIDHFSSPVKRTLGLALFLCASIVVIHHRRLHKRLERHRNFVDVLRKLAVDASLVGKEGSKKKFEEFVSDALRSLVFIVQDQNNRRPCAFAALLYRTGSGEPFRIFDQSPSGRYPRQLKIDGEQSAAAKVADYSHEETLYIPWTRLRHGVKITSAQNEPEERVSQRRTKSVPGAMHISSGKNAPDFLPSSDPNARRSLLLSRVAFEVPGNSPRNSSVAILCVETNKRACLGELDFHAIQVMGILIGTLLKRVLNEID